MIDLGPAPQPPTKDELLKILRDPLDKLLKEQVEADVDPDRTWSLRNAQKSYLYWRGLQYVAPLFNNGVLGWGPTGSPIANIGNTRGPNFWGAYDYSSNIIRGYGRKFTAALGTRPPNVVAVPDDPDDDESLAVTKMADSAAAILRNQWGMEQRQLELAMTLWLFGTAFIYTPWVTNGYKYGTRSEPNVVSRTVQTGPPTYKCVNCGAEQPTDETQPPPPACPQCQQPASMTYSPAPTMDVPETQGFTQYDNGAAEFHLCNIMTVSCPYFSTGVDDMPWISYEFDEYRATLKKLYPSLRKNPPPDGGSGSTSAEELGSQIRAQAESPLATSSSRTNRWTYKRVWLKPEVYQALEDDATVEMLEQNFPDGIKITRVGGTTVDVENEKLTDVWAVCKPETSLYVIADGICQDMMSAQDLKNDGLNIAYQTIEGGIPPTFVDPRVIDVEAWNRQQSTPNRIIPTLPGIGTQLGDAFYQPIASQFSQQMMPWLDGVEGDARTIVGTIDTIWGAGFGDDSTAHQVEIQKNAAYQQLQMTYSYMRKATVEAYRNGARQLAKYGAGTMKHVQRGEQGFESQLLDIASLSETGWHYEAEEEFPMTHGERRAALLFLLQIDHAILQGLGVTHPRNVAKANALLGISGWYSPGEDEHMKAQETIRELLKAAPIQQPDGSMQPSIPIDQFEDRHDIMAQEAQAWALSQIGRNTRKSNEQGYQNVIAWGMEHMKAAQPPPQPPPAVPTKLNVSAKISELTPDERGKLDQDTHLAPGTPPMEAQEPSMPVAPGFGAPPSSPQAQMPPGGPQPAIQ